MMSDAEKAKILIVDDVPSKLTALEAALESLDQTVVAVTSGAEALRQLLVQDFAVILLDVNMPELDGFETAALIRQRKRSEHTPIIFLTAYPDDAYADKGYALGAVDYILAPPSPEALRSKVAVFVDLYHKTEQIKRQADQRVLLAEEQAARLAAEQANLAKSQFLTNMSHELRTPMTAVIGMTELALLEDLPPNVRQYLSAVDANARLLLDLLNDILDLSKLEAGKFALENAPLNIREIVEEIAHTFGYRTRQEGLEFQLQIAEALPLSVIGDSRRLRQVLINLLNNAIKFTERGFVRLSVEVDSARSAEAWLRFTVVDSGIGVSEADQQRIFSPFTQVDASSSRRHAGAGLGLAIVSELVRAMGGFLSLQSELGRGSAFSFAIPLAIDATVPAKSPAPATNAAGGRNGFLSLPPSEAPLSVLLAEDTPTNRMLVIHALGKRGHHVDAAEDGETAVELAQARDYDVILMDLQMPGMDGFEATAAVRALPGKDRVPIVALTAHTMVGDRERCLAAGMDNYLPKPLDLRKLVEVVEGCGRRAGDRPLKS